MKNFFLNKVILIITMILMQNAWAIPGMDIVQALKQYYVLLKQLKELKKQVLQAKNMIDQGKRAIRDAEGHYGFGHLLDSKQDYHQRQWGFSYWGDALKNLSGGNSARYQELLKAYQKKYSPLSKKQFSKGASQTFAKNYKNLVDNNRVATVSADYEYENIKSHLDDVHQLTQKIDSAPNTKAAMDLNSRLIAELSYISVEELRMQTLMNHQMAAQVADKLNAKKNEAIFNQLPKEK